MAKQKKEPKTFLYLGYTAIEDYCHFSTIEEAEASARESDADQDYLVVQVCVAKTQTVPKPRVQRKLYTA